MLKDDLVKRYGPTMTIQNLSEVLKITKGAIYNKLSKNKFEIDVFKLGGKVFAETSDVVTYIDNAKLMRRKVNHG